MIERLVNINFIFNESVFRKTAEKNHHSRRARLATEMNKNRIVLSREVTISNFTIGFGPVDLVGKEVWLVALFLKCGVFSEWNLKSGVYFHVFSKQLVGPIHPNFFCCWKINPRSRLPLKLGGDDVILTVYDMLIFQQKKIGWIGPTSCLLNLEQKTLLFRFQPLKKPTFQEQIHQPNLLFH